MGALSLGLVHADEIRTPSESNSVMHARRPGPTDRREEHLLDAAQAGDERSFRELLEIHRPRLQAHCYRMLGVLQDAEDAYQDTTLRAWRALEGFNRESRLSTWLYRIATNVCLSQLRGAQRRFLPTDLEIQPNAGGGGIAPVESSGPWISAFPDAHLGLTSGQEPGARYEQRETIELAFVAALQHLPPRQRAALLLADVLGFTTADIAGMLGTTPTAVASALQRARAALPDRLPPRTQQVTVAALGDRAVAELATRFVNAFEEGDVEEIVALLTDDVRFEMPPHPETAKGRREVARSWLIPARRPTGLKLLPTTANGQLAFGVYSFQPELGEYVPSALDVVELRHDGICRIVAFRGTTTFDRLGLPAVLRPRDGESTQPSPTGR